MVTSHHNNCKFIDLINAIENIINGDILKVKNKISKKIDIIKYLDSLNLILPDTNIAKLQYEYNLLRTQSNETNHKQLTLKNYDTLNKTLGAILHNIYQSSGFNLLLLNIPLMGETSVDSQLEYITDEHIIDTLKKYGGDDITITRLVRLHNDTYIAHISNINIARHISELLNNKLIANSVIRVEFIEHKCNELKDIDDDISFSSTNIINELSIYSRIKSWINGVISFIWR